MGNIVCYCSMDVMAQCVAKDIFEQQSCHFSSQSSNGKRCMHLNENMNNHCWNPKAYDFSSVHGVVRLEDIEDEPEIIFDESLELELPDGPRRTCKDCLMYTSCTSLIDLAVATAIGGGVTDQDLWDMGSNCFNYLEETKINISGGTP